MDRLGDRIVGAMPADERAEFVDAEPGNGAAGVDGELAERFAEVRLAGAAWPADAQVFVPVDPFQGS
jgi:hypothetical protein